MKPFNFIITTTFLNFILMIPIVLVLITLDIDEADAGIINAEKHSFWGLFALAVVVAPIIETLLGQTLPIRLTQKVLNRNTRIIPILLSAVLFSLMHFGHSFWYSLLVFPMGILLAGTYIIFDKRKESSFWMTTAVHSFRNLVGVISIFYGID